MNTKALSLLLLSLILCSVFSCQRPFLADDEVSSGANWIEVGFESERQIQNSFSTPFEWHTISENEFFRYDANDELLEKRPLARGQGVLGIPALSDNTFIRLTTNDNAEQVLEFHLTRNPSEIHRILADSLKGPNDSFAEVEFQAHRLGAFSTDGTRLLVPIQTLPDRHYTLLLFEVLHNASHTSFTSVKVIKRIELTELSTDLARLNAVRFVNGNFYITSQEGAWRITPSGNSEKIFTQWMLDVFPYQGDVYITGINSFDLHQSTDNGINWERLNQNSSLKLVRNTNELLLTQPALGVVYQLSDENLLNAKNIALPPGFTAQDPVFFSAFFFEGHYYFSLDRFMFKTDAIIED